MKVLTIYARIYLDCLTQALGVIGKNLWTLLLPVAAFVASSFAGALLAPLGIVGGFILGFLTIALYSSYLFFVAGLVQSGRVAFSDLKSSFGGLFWPVMGVAFVVWIARLVVGLLAGGLPNGGAIQVLLLLAIALLVFINPTPETIYDRGSSSGMDTLRHSFQFVQANWIEWYLPNLLVGGVFYLVWSQAWRLGAVGSLGALAVLAAFFHLAMVFRGFLYKVLDGSTHRQRMFRARGGM